MPRGRKRRNRNFEQRAEQFLRANKRAKGVTEFIRDHKPVRVGTGNNRRLLIKSDLSNTRFLRGCIVDYLKQYSITPERFILVTPAEYNKNGAQVQEYFHKPSIGALYEYMFARSQKRKPNLGAEDFRLCKMFMGYSLNKRLNPVFIHSAFDELAGYGINATISPENMRQLTTSYHDAPIQISESNVVVLGTTRNGKLRLAIVDV